MLTLFFYIFEPQAEAKQAIGDDVSESSGSIMSNIDWDAVDKIMNES